MNKYEKASGTHAGRVRSLNEDCMTDFLIGEGAVMVVCDGMGGQNAGDKASQLTCSIIKDVLTDNAFDSIEETITQAMNAANIAVLRMASQNPAMKDMGTTCVMAVIGHDRVYYGSVGDSRLYYIHGNAIEQLTKDESYVQTLIDKHEMTAEEAAKSEYRNLITNAIGVEGMTPPQVCTEGIEPEPGSYLLLCTDGLTNMLSNADIEHTVNDCSLTLQQKVDKLIEKANHAGGEDNVTVTLVRFSSEDSIHTTFIEDTSDLLDSGKISIWQRIKNLFH